MIGSEEPRIYTPPLRELTPETSLGFAVIEFAEEVLDMEVLPWQRWLLIHALELTEDGLFRFRVVLVLVARQNGKTFLAVILSLFFMYVLQVPLTLGTAQSVELSEETWDDALTTAEGIPELQAEIIHVSRSNGAKAFELRDGQKYKIAAATRKGGRGKASNLVLMDEMREQTNWDAWGAISKTTMARPDALIWCMSNAGDAHSVVLRHLRMQAHVALGDPDGIAEEILESLGDEDEDIQDDTLGLFEWSADPELDTADERAWCQANPSLGYGFLTERALKSAHSTDPEPVFRTECLCQWVEAVTVSPFPDGMWESGIDETSEIAQDSELYFGMDISQDRTKTAIAVCGKRSDGLWHIEVTGYRTGFGWAVDWLKKHPGTKVSLQARGAPISSYIADLEALETIEVVPCGGRDLGGYCGRFYDAVCAETTEATHVLHRSQPILDHAALIAQKRNLGDASWAWDRGRSNGDISPLVAATMAFGLATGGQTEETRKPSAYDARGIMFV